MVEWKKLGDICEIIRGNGVQKTDFVEDGVGCIHYGQIYTHYGSYTYTTKKFVSKETFEKARKASKGDIIMTDTSENVEDICKSVAYLGEDDIAVSNHALILKHNQNPKFLSYSTLTNSFLEQKRKFVVGVKVSGIKPEQLARIKIYLPSLSEQNRIVGILDTFTSSIENLKQQIAERRKQYEHYRDQLLDLEGKPGVEMKTLGDMCSFIRGPFGGALKKEIFKSEGFVVYEQQHAIYGRWDFRYHIDEQKYKEMKRFEVKAGDILMSCSGTMGKTSIVPDNYEKGIINQALLKLTVNANAINRFVKLYMDSRWFQEGLKKQTAGGAIQNVASVSVLKSIGFPVPSLIKQKLIVDILDKFEASIQNLEAQLAQREKQYEYYRNKLLTFE